MNDVIKFFGPPDRRAEKCFLLRLSAAVIAAGMTFFVAAAGMFLPVVVTHGIGIVDKIACDKRCCVLVGISHGAGIDLNAGLSESVSGAAADPAANQIVVSPTVISSITRRITTSKSQIILIVSGVRASTCHTSLRQMSFRIRKDGDGSFSKLSPLFLIF